MTEPTWTRSPKRFQDLTGSAWAVLLIAIVSVIVGVLALAWNGKDANPDAIVVFIPHILIIALLSTGFRRTGESAGILFGGILFVMTGLMYLMSGINGGRMNTAMGVFALLQLLMAICASHVWNRQTDPPQPVPVVNRLLGLAVPGGVYMIALWMLSSANVRQQVRVAQVARMEKANAADASAAWLNVSSLPALLELAKCVEQLRGDSIAGPAPASLSASPASEASTNAEHRRCESSDIHHVVYYEPPAKRTNDPFHRAEFTLGIQAVWDSAQFPDALGKPGTRNYLLDPRGNVHVTSENRKATAADSVIPLCSSRDVYWSTGSECVPELKSRQRWGVVNRLPQLDVSLYPRTHLPDSARLQLNFAQINALDSARSVTIDWGDRRSPTIIAIPPSESINYVTRRDNVDVEHRVALFLHHVYQDTGWKIVRARLVTRAGEAYEGVDSTLVEKEDPGDR